MSTGTRKELFIIFLFWFFLLASQKDTLCTEIPINGIGKHITNGGYAIEIDGKIARSYNSEKKFIPASTIKVLTGLMALEILGPDYRFATRFYLDDARRLYIQGSGDPFLTSEQITKIAKQLKKNNIHTVKQIVLDDSAFQLEGLPPGSQNSHKPYDASSAALAVNFNALPFKVVKHTIQPLEKQTPVLPIMKDVGKNFPSGRYRVNVSAYSTSKSHDNILRYSGELFSTLFTQQHILQEEPYTIGRVPPSTRLIHLYESDKKLSEMVRLTLYYSSNFIANQLFLASGKRVYGAPATWRKSRLMAQKYLTIRLGFAPDQVLVKDGSGLSTENRISPKDMIIILNRFAPYANLLRYGNGIYKKSGTLTGVYCYVGFIEKKGGHFPFALYLNQSKNTRKAALEVIRQETLSLHNAQ